MRIAGAARQAVLVVCAFLFFPIAFTISERNRSLKHLHRVLIMGSWVALQILYSIAFSSLFHAWVIVGYYACSVMACFLQRSTNHPSIMLLFVIGPITILWITVAVVVGMGIHNTATNSLAFCLDGFLGVWILAAIYLIAIRNTIKA